MSAATDPVRVLLVDDEPLARQSLSYLLDRHPDMRVVGECGDGGAAVAAIAELSPDIVFLDIQMPEMGGFDVLRRIPPRERPLIVFVTAWDRYAVRAFEVHALDYLLKPVSEERFDETLGRVRQTLRAGAGGSGAAAWTSLLNGATPGAVAADSGGYLARLAVRLNGRIRFVQTGEIDWIEAADYYARLHVGERSYLIRRSMKSLEKELDPERFLRVHRGAIVQADRVVELRRLPYGAHSVVLRDGTTVRLSRSRRGAIEKLVDGRRAARR